MDKAEKAKMTKEEARWRLEDDVRTLRNYAELAKDKNRLQAAEKFLKAQTEAVDSLIKTMKKKGK